MLKAFKASLAFMSIAERVKWSTLTSLRAILSLLDLAGILAIGFIVTSTAVFLTAGSDPDRTFDIAGLQVPAVNAQSLPLASAAVLALFLTKAALSYILTKKVALFVANIEARAAKRIAELCFSEDIGGARKRSKEEVMYAIQTASPHAFNSLLNSVNAFVSEAVLFLVICIGFLFVDPIATLAAVLYFSTISIVIQYFVGSLMSKAGLTVAENSVKANTAISDLLAVFRELLVLDKRNHYIDRIYEARTLASESAAKQHYLGSMPRFVIESALLVGVALFVLSQAFSGDLVGSAATIGVFLSGGFRLTAALLPLQNALLIIKSVSPSAMKAHEILASAESGATSDLQSIISKIKMRESPGPIGFRFSNVSYSYPGAHEPVIRNLSFEVKPGSQVAIMGASGAGKSTIADLLCRVLHPTDGSIERSRADENTNASLVIDRVSYVPQRPGLVSGTILENVALAVEPHEMDRNLAMEAIEQAHLSQFISSLPKGLDTPLGKLQDGLSGGQIQRLGLARALYSKPRLMVMDEATSALDAESESEIQKALADMRGVVTVVLIAHRLNTIQHADQVLFIDKGVLRDQGTFQELLRKNPSIDKIVSLMNVERSS
jgi:ABC-type multidrug transport system fused ATPase/permease subunit